MDVLLYLIPIALMLGLVGLVAFVWSLKTGQFDDPEGNASRIFQDDNPQNPSRNDSGEPR